MSKFHKVYGPADSSKIKHLHVGRVRKLRKEELSVEQRFTPEQVRHIQACVHYTHMMKSAEAEERLAKGISVQETDFEFRKDLIKR